MATKSKKLEMTAKVPVDAPTAEARIFGDVEDRIKELDNLTRHEFWAMAAVALTNLISVAAVMGWVDTTSVEVLTKSITALVGGTEIIVVNAILLYKYFSGAQTVKHEIVRARIELAHAKFQAHQMQLQMKAAQNG